MSHLLSIRHIYVSPTPQRGNLQALELAILIAVPGLKGGRKL